MNKNILDFEERKCIFDLKHGSYDAFNQIYLQYSRPLFSYCLQYLKSREDTEEMVQDVFVKLWTYRESIKQEESIKNFIFTIAKNSLINAYRSRVNDPIYEEYVDYCNELKLSQDSALDIIEYDDFIKQLNRAMMKLPEKQRTIIEYCKLKQLSNKEVAEKLNLSEQTVKNQLSMGLKTLKQSLKYVPFFMFVLLFK